MGAREFDEPLALLGRQRVAGRVLEGGDDVGELRAGPGGQHPLDRRHVDAVVLELDRPHVRAAVAEREQRAVVRGALDDHRVAGLDQGVEQERVGLHRPVRDEHPARLDLVALRDQLAQRRIPDRGPVGRRSGRIVGERALGGRLQSVDVDDVERRRAARE